jgi:hypothetical protein
MFGFHILVSWKLSSFNKLSLPHTPLHLWNYMLQNGSAKQTQGKRAAHWTGTQTSKIGSICHLSSSFTSGNVKCQQPHRVHVTQSQAVPIQFSAHFTYLETDVKRRQSTNYRVAGPNQKPGALSSLSAATHCAQCTLHPPSPQNFLLVITTKRLLCSLGTGFLSKNTTVAGGCYTYFCGLSWQFRMRGGRGWRMCKKDN